MYKLPESLFVKENINNNSSILSNEEYQAIYYMCVECVENIESKDEMYQCVYKDKVLITLLHTSELEELKDMNSDEFIALIDAATEEDIKTIPNVFILVEKKEEKNNG